MVTKEKGKGGHQHHPQPRTSAQRFIHSSEPASQHDMSETEFCTLQTQNL